MPKPRFNNEISTGHILAIVGFLAAVGLFEIPKASSVSTIQVKIQYLEEAEKKQDEIIKEIMKLETIQSENLKVLTTEFQDHKTFSK